MSQNNGWVTTKNPNDAIFNLKLNEILLEPVESSLNLVKPGLVLVVLKGKQNHNNFTKALVFPVEIIKLFLIDSYI